MITSGAKNFKAYLRSKKSTIFNKERLNQESSIEGRPTLGINFLKNNTLLLFKYPNTIPNKLMTIMKSKYTN